MSCLLLLADAESSVEGEDVIFNYCLLLCKSGRLAEGRQDWLEWVGKKPVSRAHGLELLREERSKLQKRRKSWGDGGGDGGGGGGPQSILLSVAMLQHWTQHSTS